MKTFIVTSPGECRSIGSMERPEFKGDYFLHYGPQRRYEEYIAGLPRYPILSSHNYEVGEEISGEFGYQVDDVFAPGWFDTDKEGYDMVDTSAYNRRIVVIPVQQEKEDVLDKSRQTLESFLEMSDEEILNKIKEIKDRLSIRTT